MTDNSSSVEAAREHATKSWLMFTDGRNVDSPAPAWEESVAPDGSHLLSGRVSGRRAVWALKAFAADFYLNLPHPGDIRPQFDIDVPDRTVLVWRRDGVWVELWHPTQAAEPPQAAPEPSTPVQGVPAPAPSATPATFRRWLMTRPGGRLPYTRRNKTPKETPAA